MFTTKFPKFDRMLPNGSQIQPIVGRSDVGSNKFGEFSEFGKFHKLFLKFQENFKNDFRYFSAVN